MKNILVMLALALLVSPLLAQEEDAEGCKDSARLSRMKSCRIESCDQKDFDSAQVRTGPDEGQMKDVEGQVETIIYSCLDNVSFLQMARNAENALKLAGFTTVYAGKGTNEYPSYTGRKGGVWVHVQTQPNGSQTYTQTIITTKEMEQQMVASAESMEADITKSGYCSIYGIHFDTGKASILPDSAECLGEMAKVMKKNAAWKLQVEGHTDNVGGKETNMKLSQARADSVRLWLTEHGVQAARLTSKGFGETKPVAGNMDEEGRAKNRRVDLRKL